MNKLAIVATVLCAASLVAAPADAKTKRHAKPAAAAPTQYMANAGPRHDPGGPVRSGNLCWKDFDPWGNRGLGYWAACPK